MSNQLLIISGPTATGKTALAVKMTKLFNGEIISADSRQIYKGLDIGVGKDHPKNIKIHLIDLIDPDQSFSVASYRTLALKTIRQIQSQNKLPILVGCSGFYIDSIINSNYDTLSIKPNFFLRSILFKTPIRFQQFILKHLDLKTYQALNNSDLHNPLRLIRKIEIALSNKKKPSPPLSKRGLRGDLVLHISLTAPNYFLYQRIDQRVEDRLKIGHLNELKKLLKKYHWSDPGLKVSAYASFKDCFAKKTTINQAVQKWKYLEHGDARRQKTWLKKRKNLKFLDVSKPNFSDLAIKATKKWYNKA